MKALLNWRYYVMTTLLSIGIISVMMIAGEDDRSLLDWLIIRLILGVVSVACFYALSKLTTKWERENLIPEFSNQICN